MRKGWWGVEGNRKCFLFARTCFKCCVADASYAIWCNSWWLNADAETRCWHSSCWNVIVAKMRAKHWRWNTSAENVDDKIKTSDVPLLEITFLELAITVAAQMMFGRPDWRVATRVGNQKCCQLCVGGREWAKFLGLCSKGEDTNPLGRSKSVVKLSFHLSQSVQQKLAPALCWSHRHERGWLQTSRFPAGHSGIIRSSNTHTVCLLACLP